MKRLVSILALTALVFSISMLGFMSDAAHAAAATNTADKKSETELYKGSKTEIDATYKNDAYISVKLLEKSSKKYKVTIEKGEVKYTYDLNNKGDAEIFSMQMGDGKYTVKVLENISGTKYSVVQKQEIDVKCKSANAPFLVSTQNVKYDSKSKAVIKAAEICKTAKTDLDKVEKIYQYVVENVSYDTEKAKKIINGDLSGYLPDVDIVLTDKKGICFDYSSLMAAMLRSQGIPTKLIMGYVAPNNVYHAWNEVYISGIGWVKIQSSVYFDGKSWSRMDSTFASSNKSGTKTSFIGDGSNYTKKYEY